LKFLIDNALSPIVARNLALLGHDPVHVRDLGMQAPSDGAIFDRDAAENRIVVSADTDFGTLLAARKGTKPSVILFRHGSVDLPTRPRYSGRSCRNSSRRLRPPASS
jgi:predicted nuclease of predicted toxin-antitoxin system